MNLRMNLNEKIAHLVRELGWTQEDFARRARLNRHTARHILLRPQQQLRNRTIQSCASALGLTVAELTEKPVRELLERIRGAQSPLSIEEIRAAQPELANWLEDHPERATGLSAADMQELVSRHGPGRLSTAAIEHFIDRLHRKREFLRKVEILASTEHFPFLELMANLLFEKVQPYWDH
jgi:transcriptional regulator with XRE-family HTH domain